MAKNKNRNLIVAYFPDVESADKAARQLKNWDKENKAVKLGGMGIISEHKGEIKVESEIGKGTTFSLFLPIRRSAS